MTEAIKADPVVQHAQLKHMQLMRRSGRLRAHGNLLPSSGFLARRHYLTTAALVPRDPNAPAADGDDGIDEDEENEQEQQQQEAAASNPMDPMGMMDGMKQNMLMIVPNMLLMGWVSYFFAGFVLVKLPFPLSDRFKPMLQRGIGLRSLDSSYVSSLSWYFLNMFGLRGVYALLLGTDANTGGEDQFVAQMAGGGMGMAAGGLGGTPDHTATYAAEKTEVEIVHHDWALIADAQYRILGLQAPGQEQQQPGKKQKAA
jgi:hypothetical protein